MRDLLLAGVDARTIALGFWAAELSESERRRRSRLCLAAFIVLAACSPIAGAFPPFVSSFVLFAMLVVGFHWSILGATPHHVLARLLATVRYSVGTARSRSQVAYLAWRWLYPGWAAARSTILVLIFAFLGLAFLPGLARVFLVTDPAMAPLQTIGVFAFGWTLGKARGRFLETQAGDLVPQIIAEVEAYRDRFKAHLDARA
jgi:hypothetical protein